MRKNMNDRRLAPSAITISKGQAYFIQRWDELLHYNTANSYRYRLLNARSILLEILSVIEDYQRTKLGFTHIQSLIEEACTLFSADIAIRNHNNALRIAILKVLGCKLEKDDIEIRRVEIQVKQFLSIIKGPVYLSWIIDDLSAAIIGSDIDCIEKLTIALVSEAMQLGWNNISLLRLNRLFIRNRDWFSEKWNLIISNILSEKVDFKCYGECNINPDNINQFSYLPLVMKSSDTPYLNENKVYFDLGIIKSFKQDTISVINKAKDKFTEMMSVVIFSGESAPTDLNNYLAMNDTNTYSNLKWRPIDIRHPEYNSERQISLISEMLMSTKINNESKERIKNSLLQYSIGFDDVSIQKQFLSHWSALESIICIGYQPGGITGHLVKIIPGILCYKYVYQNVKQLMFDINKCNILGYKDIKFDNFNDDTVYGFIEFLRHADTKEFEDICARNTLLLSRLLGLKYVLSSNKSMYEYITSHMNRLVWHIKRLYRTRNQLTHYAYENVNLETLSIHLNEYYKIIVTEVIELLISSNFTDLGEGYCYFENNLNVLLSYLKDRSSPAYDSSYIINGIIKISS